MGKQFKVGVAREIISPKLGTLLQGYPRKRPASKIYDNLTVSAIAFSNGDICGLMISAEVLQVPAQTVNMIKELVSNKTGVDKENITFSATHTHSGPSLESMAGWGEANSEYLDGVLIPQTIKASKIALENMIPAVMGVSTTESSAGVNRREYNAKGGVSLGQNPFGVSDKTMTVVAFKDLSGKPILNIVHYGCHPTSAGSVWYVTRDWPGVMIDSLEKHTGATTVFFNGAEGDVGPRVTNGRTGGDSNLETGESTMMDMVEVGSLAALDATRAFKQIKEYRDVDFKIIKGKVSLPYKPLFSVEEVNARLNELGDPNELHDASLREHASLMEVLKIHQENAEIESALEYDQALFAFNSTVFVPFPFEMFSSIALRLRKFSPFENTLCVALTNGSYSYLPGQEDLVRGGYEVNMFRGGVYKLKDDTDWTIVKENLRIMSEGLNN